MKADNKDLKAMLKKALAGKATANEVRRALARDNSIVTVLELPDGTFSVDDRQGLTEAQMLEAISGKGEREVFRVKILASHIPVFHSEKEAEAYWDVSYLAGHQRRRCRRHNRTRRP